MGLDYTGNIRYRKGFFGSVVVQLEYRYQYSQSAFNDPNDTENLTGWRDATTEDLMNIKSTVPLV